MQVSLRMRNQNWVHRGRVVLDEVSKNAGTSIDAVVAALAFHDTELHPGIEGTCGLDVTRGQYSWDDRSYVIDGIAAAVARRALGIPGPGYVTVGLYIKSRGTSADT